MATYQFAGRTFTERADAIEFYKANNRDYKNPNRQDLTGKYIICIDRFGNNTKIAQVQNGFGLVDINTGAILY